MYKCSSLSIIAHHNTQKVSLIEYSHVFNHEDFIMRSHHDIRLKPLMNNICERTCKNK